MQSWEKMPLQKPLESEKILDTRIAKKTKRKEYLEYLVKWKVYLVEDSSWIDVVALRKIGYSIEDIMNRRS